MRGCGAAEAARVWSCGGGGGRSARGARGREKSATRTSASITSVKDTKKNGCLAVLFFIIITRLVNPRIAGLELVKFGFGFDAESFVLGRAWMQ